MVARLNNVREPETPQIAIESREAPILVVDDDATNRDLLSRRLLKSGYDVATASSGSEALEKISTDAFSLILLDHMMPGISGLDVLRDLRADPATADLPVIMVTANGDSADIVTALQLGANDYVVKPIDFDVLLARTETHLQLLRAKLDLRDANKRLESLVAERTSSLNASRRRYRVLYDDSPAMFLTLGERLQVVTANKFGLTRLGYTHDEIVGLPCACLFPDLDPTDSDAFFKQCLSSRDRVHHIESTMLCKNGTPLTVKLAARGITSDSDEPFVLVVGEDTTELQRLTSALSFEMRHDNDTGLLNRRAFEDKLNDAIVECHISEEPVQNAVMVIRLDRSELTVEAMGVTVLEEQMRQVAEQLSSRVTSRMLVARLDRETFAVLSIDSDEANATLCAADILNNIRDIEFYWGDVQLGVTASIGLTIFDASAKSSTTIIRQGELACRRAAGHGGDRHKLFQVDDDPAIARRDDLEWLTRVQAALQDDHFCLYAQAIRATDESKDTGLHYEVLVRMQGADGNVVSPGRFLPVVDRYNLGLKLDHWVLSKAFSWLRDNPGHVSQLSLCSINLSGCSLSDMELLSYLLRTLRDPRLPADKLCFEITESVAISNLSSATSFMAKLQQLGCRFALDDFGTGVSSFAYLQDLPVDIVKIDGSFVRGVAEDPAKLAVVNSINDIAHAFGKQTVAEFVDKVEAFELLRSIGVDFVQGYLFDEPHPLDDASDAR